MNNNQYEEITQSNEISEYEQILYNIEQRMNKQINPNIYKFNGEITSDNIKTYTKERERKIKLIKQKEKQNQLFNIDLWDIAFASSYGFPDNSIGFYGQWMNNKIAPIAKYLTEIDLLENVHICYRAITDTDEQSLNYLCDNIIVSNRLQYQGRRSSGPDEDNIIAYNSYINSNYVKNKPDEKISFELFNWTYHSIEQNPIEYICSGYNNFYLEPFGARNKSNNYVTISKYEDIEEALKEINDCSSSLYTNNEENFKTIQTEWHEIIKKVNCLFDTVGHDKPLWTAFLPENIEKFEEVRVLTNCGNFLNIVARSEKYFYFMQYSH